ncbi:uncharacterized protein LOC129586849 [Paramacrobiotus metropolitanus]|uniref:uncharacterized protein LOC129586849 n=1 Tax=Paramacrobiotus metropolitanus TaxID=2943436 RepID=UPI002446240A|nr:uncharacterized protein LOC129586849 [Paramacrobiotus metropolitanus]
MFALSSNVAITLGILRRILNGAWTIVTILLQFCMLLYAAAQTSRYHNKILEVFKKIEFLRKTKAPSEYRQQETLKVLEILNDSKRSRGFSIAFLVDINEKVVSMLLVYICGYIMFAIDRMQNGQSLGSSLENPMKINLTSCHQRAFVASQNCTHLPKWETP